MAGLLNPQQQPGPGASPAPGMNPAGMNPLGPAGGVQPSAEGALDEEGNVTPEEQAAYDQFVTNGMEVMYSDQVMPQILETIQGSGNPVEGLGNAVAMLAIYLDDSARESGSEIPGDVKYHGSVELLEQMAELAEQAGIHQFSEEDLENALYVALDTYRTTQQAAGKLPVEELQQDMNELVAAEQTGTIDQILPGISEYAKRAPAPEGAGQQQGQKPSGGLIRNGG